MAGACVCASLSLIGCCLGFPQELIADYYGEATAFYFAWMGFYTQGLIIPSIFGVIVFGCQVNIANMHRSHRTGLNAEF